MTLKATNIPTLHDVVKLQDPNGGLADVSEMLQQSNEVLTDCVWKEGNLPTGHRTTIRTSLPSGRFRRLNQGVPTEKSTTTQVDEGAAMLEAFSVVDRKLAILAGNPAAYRLQESKAFIEGMGQNAAETMFYGNATVNEEEFTGFAPRYNTKTGVTGEQVVDCGGTGTDNTSIWIVVWGDHVHGIYPKGTKAGLFHEDATANKTTGSDGHMVGDVLFDAAGGRYMGYTDHYEWNMGLSVRDHRYVVRLANIDVSDLRADKGATGKLIENLIIGLGKLPRRGFKWGAGVRPVIYMNSTCFTAFDLEALKKSNVQLGMREFAGEEVLSFRGLPFRQVDQLVNTEARVV